MAEIRVLNRDREPFMPGHASHNDRLTLAVRTCKADDRPCKANLNLHVVEWEQEMPEALEYAGRLLIMFAAQLREGSARLDPQDHEYPPEWRMQGAR